jgi:MoxR-like ATPase
MTPVVSSAAAPPTPDPRAAFQRLEADLALQHLERGPVIHGLLLGLLARQHVVLLGPPGTGKSRLVRDVAVRCGLPHFEWLLTRMSTPEELFGPISLAGLEQDRYVRVTAGKLPAAQLAFLDEVFKGSSAILNALLAVLNERVFHNDGRPQPVPLQIAVGASNELPEDREELAALWDRFLLRFVIDPLRDDSAFTTMLTLPATPTPTVTLDPATLAAAQAACAQVAVDPALPTLAALRRALAQEGLAASDRRWHDAVAILRANAWLRGQTAVTDDTLDVLADILWDTPDQRPTVARTVLQVISPYDREAQDLLDDAYAAYQEALQAPEAEQTQVGLAANKALKAAAKQLAALGERARQAGRPSVRAEAGLQQVAAWGEEVLRICLQVG